MTERERLIELLKKSDNKLSEYIRENDTMDYIPTRDELYGVRADYLLANGGLFPPCKVGDVVYEALPKVGFIRSNKVVGFHLGKFPDTQGHKRKEYLVCYSDYSLTHIAIDKFGKTVFLTKEEAEQALRGEKE